jgi:hypothetical protein
MVARPILIASIASLLLGTPALASPALAGTGTPAGQAQGVPPPQDRIAATNATFNAIEAKIAAGQSLRLRFPDPTAAQDIIDYGLHDLWKRAIDGAGVTVAYVVTNPDPNLATAMATYDMAMDLPPADITDMALPAPTDPSKVCQIECSTGEDRLDAEAIHSMAPYANIISSTRRCGNHRHAGLAGSSPGHQNDRGPAPGRHHHGEPRRRRERFHQRPDQPDGQPAGGDPLAGSRVP